MTVIGSTESSHNIMQEARILMRQIRLWELRTCGKYEYSATSGPEVPALALRLRSRPRREEKGAAQHSFEQLLRSTAYWSKAVITATLRRHQRVPLQPLFGTQRKRCGFTSRA